jgi:uncharacterized membrane protein
MTEPRITPSNITDTSIERIVSVILRAGVLISGAVVLAGGIYFLLRHAGERVHYHPFSGQPSIDRFVSEIVKGAMALRARSIIQFGILLLIATPITRVALSLVGFALERDRTYVVITAIVLATLLFSFIGGAVQG